MYESPYRVSALQFPRRSMPVFLSLVAIGVLYGCGKGDKIPTTAERLSSVQQKQETQPDFYVPRKTVDYMTDLKSLKDAPAKPDPAAARAEPIRSTETKPASQETKTAAAPAPVQTAPQPAVLPPPAVAAPPANVVASSAPTARPAPRQEAAALIVIAREQPAFPRDALRAGVESGIVRARMTINAAGEVTNVAILQAQPTRVFDRAVQQALGHWKFNAGTDGRTFDTEVAFKAAN